MSGISTSRHHADWLSLIEVSGPFVSLPVLLKVFPQGLDPRDPAQAKVLRTAYEDWQGKPTAPGRQRAWVLHVLTALLGYPAALIVENQALPAGLEANMAEMGETLRPDFALVSPAGSEAAGQAQLLISSYPAEQALDRPVIGKHWKANPGTRMMELLHASGVALGLVTNGEHWMLVFAPRGETTGYASWHGALWLDEPVTLRAFHSLLGVRRFFGVAVDDTLQALLKESAQDQQEVTDQLGYQVREAVEVLVQAFDILDQDANRTLLKGVSEPALYEAALTVMMRLVFLFSAEERGLLHLGKPLYDDNYAVSTLLEQLQEVADLHGPQVLERRCDAWARLLATFRAVHAGVHHQDLLIPAYGGSLFDPDRFPFLEGRSIGTNWVSTQAEPLAVNNRVALHLLTSLQRLRIKMPSGGPSESRRISFLALGVEQIGHVYEGLLDHIAERAHETVLGIEGTRKKEAEIPLTTLEAKLAQGQDELIELLKDETGRSGSAIKRALDLDNPVDEHKLLIACAHDEELLQRLRPFAGVIREDSFERPLVVLPGCVYVTAGTARRSTGTHYTPPSLTQPIVQYTLEPLVYQGPAEGRPREQWQLKLPKEILDLKVCDMAMGSGAFLVQACRYLAERLTEAWENEEKKHPGEILITPEGDFSQGVPSERLVPEDAAERLAIARRIVADRCLYGVDINSMAVEMAKLSLWLITLDAKRPFTFLDHALKCGDSLLGLSNFEQLENFSLRPGGGKQIAFSTMNLWRHVDEAKRKREALKTMPSDTPEQVATKTILYAEAEEAVAKLKAAADLLMAVELKGLKGKTYEDAREVTADHMMTCWARGSKELRAYASEQIGRRRPLHWPLAFPEIIDSGGFDAFIGNPPFVFGTLAAAAFGEDYMSLLQQCNPPWNGKADLVVGFFKQAALLLQPHGVFSLIATASILRGESLDSGLRDLAAKDWTLYCARSPFKWPGTANLEVVMTSLTREWSGDYLLDGERVDGITEELIPGVPSGLSPYELSGHIAAALGVKLCPANREISHEKYLNDLSLAPEIKEFFVPAIGGNELYDLVDLELASRSIAPEKLSTFLSRGGILTRRGAIPILEPAAYAHSRPAAALTSALWRSKFAFACGETSAILCFTLVPSAGCILKHKLIVYPSNDWALFAILQSALHSAWAWRWGLRRETRLVYSPKRCAVTFPWPSGIDQLNGVAELYYNYRKSLMQSRQEGLTKTYNRFHNAVETSPDFAELRRLQVEIDQAVITAYHWPDLPLHHGFRETKQGLRYTISETARRDVLDRLLALNHQRHAQEQEETAAIQETSSTSKLKKTRRSTKGNTQVTPTLFA
jgi:hypothetical protein